jgi:death on curing protein
MPVFLSMQLILSLHHSSFATYGGAEGVRELPLLESAIAQPEATFDGQFLHETILMMAAAYCFHIVQNHPFMDGNKRTGFLAMDAFLQENGYVLTASMEDAYEKMIALAEGAVSKEQLAEWLTGVTIQTNVN